MSKILNLSIEVSDEVYNEWIERLEIVSGWNKKEELEVFIGSGIEMNIDEFEKIVFERD